MSARVEEIKGHVERLTYGDMMKLAEELFKASANNGASPTHSMADMLHSWALTRAPEEATDAPTVPGHPTESEAAAEPIDDTSPRRRHAVTTEHFDANADIYRRAHEAIAEPPAFLRRGPRTT